MLPRHFCSPALRRRSLEPCTWYVHCEVVRCGLFTSICRPICPVEKVTGFRTGNPRFESWPGHFDAQLRRLPHSALMSCTLLKAVNWPVGLMDKASAPGAGDSRFESWADHWLQERTSGEVEECHSARVRVLRLLPPRSSKDPTSECLLTQQTGPG